MNVAPPKPKIDFDALRGYRLDRIREGLRANDVALAVLVSPTSLRYAVDCREYQSFQSRIPTLYLFVPVEGPVVLHGAALRDYPLVDEYRRPRRLSVFDGGLALADRARAFAADLVHELDSLGLRRDCSRVALEMLNPSAVLAVQSAGLTAVDATPVVEWARSIKAPEEIACMRHAIAVAEHGIAQMREAMRPGIRENELWSVLHQVNVAHDGDWIDGRMLASGPRTNPWLQETSDRVIEAGDLVAFDTDMIGPFGYCADISRTWRCGEGTPSNAQRDLYQRAYEEVQHNIDLIRPGLGFREFSERAYGHSCEFVAHRYPCLAHGVGMSDEYPKIYYREDWDRDGYDGVIEEDMTLCVESFVGSDQGGEGVKLEEMVKVTRSGCERLSRYPFDEALLGRTALA